MLLLLLGLLGPPPETGVSFLFCWVCLMLLFSMQNLIDICDNVDCMNERMDSSM
jgi:hypothetical protein